MSHGFLEPSSDGPFRTSESACSLQATRGQERAYRAHWRSFAVHRGSSAGHGAQFPAVRLRAGRWGRIIHPFDNLRR